MTLERTLQKLARPWDRARLRRELRAFADGREPFEGTAARIRDELSPFAQGVSEAARERQWQALRALDPRHAARVRHRDGKLSVESGDPGNVRARELERAFAAVVRTLPLPPFDLLVDFGDRLDHAVEHAPVLVYCRREASRGQVLIPDFEALRGYESLERAIDRASRRSPWERKRPVAFWRGAPTGGRYDRDGWRELPRARLVALSLRRPELVDARFTSATHGADANPELAAEGFFGARVEPAASVAHRFLIDVDGNAASWSRVVWTLRSNSLLLKQASPFVQWYYPWLEPGRHYQQLAPDLSDLESVLEHARLSERAAREIAEEGARFARECLTHAPTLAYLAAVARECAALSR